VESTTYAKSLQIRTLQDLHTAHCSLAVHTVAAVPAKTAHKPPIKIGALIARFIVAHMVKEAKQRPDGVQAWSDLRLANRFDRPFKQMLEKRILTASLIQIGTRSTEANCC
jgi:hypothetical protein